MIYKLRPEWTGTFWGEARKHLGRLKDLDLDHARGLIEDGKWQLWLAVDRGECLAAMITEVTKEPEPVITVVNAAGRDLSVWEDAFYKRECEWAAALEAKAIRLVGRRGWRRRCARMGFKETAVILEKTL